MWCQEINVSLWEGLLTKAVQMPIVEHIDFVEKKKKIGSKSSDTALVCWSAKSVVSRRQLAVLKREQMLQQKSDQAAAIYSKCTTLSQLLTTNRVLQVYCLAVGSNRRRRRRDFFVAVLGAKLPPPLQSALTPTMRLHLLLNNCYI